MQGNTTGKDVAPALCEDRKEAPLRDYFLIDSNLCKAVMMNGNGVEIVDLSQICISD